MDRTVNLHLSHSRYARLSGETGTLDEEGGVLKITLRNSIEKLDAAAVARVEVDVLAVPKDSHEVKDFAFKLGITVEGIYEWEPSAAPPPTLSTEDSRLALSQPLYTMAVVELRNLAQKLGFGNIQLPWDIDVLSKQAHEKRSAAREPAKPKRTIKPAAKKKIAEHK